MKLEIRCVRCKRVLGYYEGEGFSLFPTVDFMEVVCNRCLGVKEDIKET
jgi:phage FluMu protein Com